MSAAPDYRTASIFAAPLADHRRPVLELCPTCTCPLGDHSLIVQGYGVARLCTTCNRVCRER